MSDPKEFPPPTIARLPVALLNAPVLTVEGWYRLTPTTVDRARELVREHGFVSAVGHESSAALLSCLLGIDCAVRRRDFLQAPGQTAIVLRLARRLPEGQVLQTVQDIEAWGYQLVLLFRLAQGADCT